MVTYLSSRPVIPRDVRRSCFGTQDRRDEPAKPEMRRSLSARQDAVVIDSTSVHFGNRCFLKLSANFAGEQPTKR